MLTGARCGGARLGYARCGGARFRGAGIRGSRLGLGPWRGGRRSGGGLYGRGAPLGGLLYGAGPDRGLHGGLYGGLLYGLLPRAAGSYGGLPRARGRGGPRCSAGRARHTGALVDRRMRGRYVPAARPLGAGPEGVGYVVHGRRRPGGGIWPAVMPCGALARRPSGTRRPGTHRAYGRK
ncbi:hypothetical protein ACFXCZ_26705 [Streptomyces sp. NPDC059396]|uniref:hypothetical protein n=1 Tax=Streptomyces sp. NPDC059396 TaxID=3346819 RepID=UPI0036B7FE91